MFIIIIQDTLHFPKFSCYQINGHLFWKIHKETGQRDGEEMSVPKRLTIRIRNAIQTVLSSITETTCHGVFVLQ